MPFSLRPGVLVLIYLLWSLPRQCILWLIAFEALVTAGREHQMSKTYSNTPCHAPKWTPRLHALPMGCLAACTLLPTSLKKTEVAFLETAVITYSDITKLRMQESENAKRKEDTESWGHYASLSIQATQVQDKDLCHQ